MNNPNIYLERMSKAIEDKLWFTKFLNLKEFEDVVVYDLGCADGELIRHLAPIYPNRTFIGLDISPDMISLAKQRQQFPNEKYLYVDDDIEEVNKTKFLIMSSVLHEIISYRGSMSIELALHVAGIDKIDPDYIFLRDMMPGESINRYSRKGDIERAKSVYGSLVTSFENSHGSLEIQRNLVHFLIKSRYKDNWNSELEENYFPINIEDIEKYFPDYQVIYKKHYILPYIQDKILEETGIEIRDKTHVNIILKRKKRV